MRRLMCGIAVAVGIVACSSTPSRQSASGGSPSGAAPETDAAVGHAQLVRVVARDFAFDSAHTVHAGLVAIRLVNDGKAMHMLGIARIDSGKTLADVYKAVVANGPLGYFTELGGPGMISPGDSTVTYSVLEPGTYSMICWVNDSTGKPHVMDGMMSTLTVTGTNAGAPALPAADVYIRETDYHIAMPDTIAAGRHLFRVDNDGPQDHDVAIVRVLPGHTDAEAVQWMGDSKARMHDVPVQALAGIVAQARRSHTEFAAELTAGDYLVVCLKPDEKDGKPHLMHGMVTHLHVT